MRALVLVFGFILAACSQPTPLTASNDCDASRATFSQFADCARAALGNSDTTQVQAYRTFLAYAEGEIRAGRATDAQAFATDAYLMQAVAANQAQQEFWRNERRAATLQSMGQQMVTMGAAPPRSTVTCNTFGRQITCF